MEIGTVVRTLADLKDADESVTMIDSYGLIHWAEELLKGGDYPDDFGLPAIVINNQEREDRFVEALLTALEEEGK